MDASEFRAEFDQIKGSLPAEVAAILESTISAIPDDLFTEEVVTWGDGFGTEGFCPGGLLVVGKGLGKQSDPDERVLSMSIDTNTWGVPTGDLGLRLTAKAVAAGRGDQPCVPTVHLTRDQWEQVKALGERVFPSEV